MESLLKSLPFKSLSSITLHVNLACVLLLWELERMRKSKSYKLRRALRSWNICKAFAFVDLSQRTGGGSCFENCLDS